MPRRVNLTGSVLLAAAMLAACQSAASWIHEVGADDPLAGTIQDIARQRAIGEGELVQALDRAEFVLLGQSHDNLDHRRLATRLVRALGDSGEGLSAVALEPIPADRQTRLVEHLAQGGDPGLRRLDAAVGWDQRIMGSFESYRPLLLAARAADAQIVAAGPSPLLVTTAMAGGLQALPFPFARRTGLLDPLPPLLAAELDQAILSTHCEEISADLVNRIAAAERTVDAGLADRLATLTGRGRGLLLATPRQIRKDLGVPWYLEKLRPGARTVSIALVEVGRAAEMETEGFGYDYVWFTPGAAPLRPEPCRAPDRFIDQREAAHGRAAGALWRS